jgi:hypothetical protein
VIIYTREACPLCNKGIAACRAVLGEENVELVDIDLDLSLMEKYTNRVPVVETSDGVLVAEGIVTESALREFNFRR